MPNHTENTRRIITYLSYLRDISRKIISRTGFEKCLLNKSSGYSIQFEDFQLEVNPDDSYYEELFKYLNFIQRNHDKRLFFGFGTVLGTRRRIFAAPILVVQCEVKMMDESQKIIIEPDLGTLNLNYDFISAILTNHRNEEDDVFNPLTEEENRTLEILEKKIKGINDFEFRQLNILAKEIFSELKEHIESFNDITELSVLDYNFKSELALYNHRPIRNLTNAQRERSIFEKNLVWINTNHFFVSTIPDQLSTYEALNSFVQSIENEIDFKNPVVEKLLINALTDERAEIVREMNGDEIQKIIDAFIPLPLSNAQTQGVKNAWTNEITYIQGPPGTGKSHTISAIVLSAIALKKKVLVISQKPAALNVVNQKIEPFLSSGDGIIGICNYEKITRQKIKDYCTYLLNQTSNTNFKLNISRIDKHLSDLEKRLNIRLKELQKEQKRLEKTLDDLRHHKELHEIFLIKLKRLNEDYSKIPTGFQFKRINDNEKYIEVLERIERLCEQNAKSLSAKLYLHKFKEHLKNKFKIPEDWLEASSLPFFSKAFVKLNMSFTEVHNIERNLNTDANSIRVTIKNLNEDILKLQCELIKYKYKLNVFENINDQSYQVEVDKFNSMLYYTNTRHIDKRMREIDFKKITDVIPFWTAEIRNLGHLFPLEEGLFDLVVVDEASQVNLAEILPAFYRGKRICIVGDHKQLSLKSTGLTFSLSTNFDQNIWNKYNWNAYRRFLNFEKATKKCLVVSRASILDYIKNETHPLNVKITEVMLDEHFRSLPQLARYTSKQFYKDEDNPDGKLKVMTETPDRIAINCFKAIPVKGTRLRNEDGETVSKFVLAEAKEVIEIISCLVNRHELILFERKYELPSHINENKFTIGVISMIRDQCEKIIELIEEKFDDKIWSQYEIMVGTPEEFQGNERDIMIFSLSLDSKCRTGQGFFQDKKRLNVATSRAKSYTYFVYSPFPRTFAEIFNYLKYIGGSLPDDEIIPNPPPELPPLNFNLFESDFERYVHSYLEEFIKKYSNGQRITLHNQIKSCGQKRLDFVIFNHDTKKSVAIEVDGRYHFVLDGLTENYSIEHIERLEILKRAGWKIINTPYHKWYKDGWLSEESNQQFRNEIERIYNEIKNYIF